jgi:hypothetical protein
MPNTVHIVLNDFGRFGPAFVETDPGEADLETIVRNLLAGHYERPIRVDAYDIGAGIARDASFEIARVVAERGNGDRLPAGVRTFCERYGALPDASGRRASLPGSRALASGRMGSAMGHGREFQNYAYRSGYLQTSLESAAEDMARAAGAIEPGHAVVARRILETAVMRIDKILARVDAADAAISERLSASRPTSCEEASIAGSRSVGRERAIDGAAGPGA